QRNKNKDGTTRGESVFRLTVDQNDASYPVFERVYGKYPYRDAGTILLKWENGGIHEYGRTLLNIESPIRHEETDPLPSGIDVYHQVRSSKQLANNKFQDMKIGFSMDYTSSPGAVLFEPHWFILYGDEGSAQWQPLDDLMKNDETSSSSKKARKGGDVS